MRALSIDLDDLVLALDSNGVEFYLDLETGEVRFRPEDDVDPEFEQLLKKQPKRFLPITPWSSSDGFYLMQRFARKEVDDEAVRQALEVALEGKKPFRSFKDRLYDFPGLPDAWHRFQAVEQHRWARHWLAEHDIEPSPASPRDV